MRICRKVYFILLLFLTGFCFSSSFAQTTQIRGFIDGLVSYQKGKASFGFGEQDLFITSELHDRISFLGESVFKYTPSSPTEFSVSIERVVIKYNLAGNHNLLIGKHHTPLNYWNDTYHHGRVFFPTIERPLLFAANIIPLHTTGASVQGHDLGKLKFGYDFMVGNGLGSGEVSDNDKNKSVTAAIHIKPVDKLRLGISYYHDVISKGADVHGKIIDWRVDQTLLSGSVAYFGKKFELLAEGTLGINKTDTTGSRQTLASYLYTGYRITEKVTPYIRLDNLNFQEGEIYFNKDNTTSIVAGIRYSLNYLAVVKLEYQHQHSAVQGNIDKVTAQFAIGF
ncbi:MAG: hypothetical protein JWM28_2838 [Chitinophagaceae bacterium]|nr:hypothetical protein [Chitinophagaceae bacterium]